MRAFSSIFLSVALVFFGSAEASLTKSPMPALGVSNMKIDVNCEDGDQLCKDFAEKAKVLWMAEGSRTEVNGKQSFMDASAAQTAVGNINFSNLEINRHLRLGMSVEEVARALGRPVAEIQGGGRVFVSELDARGTPCEAGYQAELFFVNRKLKSIELECQMR